MKVATDLFLRIVTKIWVQRIIKKKKVGWGLVLCIGWWLDVEMWAWLPEAYADERELTGGGV